MQEEIIVLAGLQTERGVLTVGLLVLLPLINDYDNQVISFLRPKGQLPFEVRRPRKN